MTAPAGCVGAAGMLEAVAERLGHSVAPEWCRAVEAAPRHRFLPDRVWVRDASGGYELVDRATCPDRWWAAAYEDAPVVTQLVEEWDGEQVPTSSASAPATVLRMVSLAGIRDGDRVLEIGTGTGWHAALLSARLGDDQVVSVEVDAGLVDEARETLARAGYCPRVEWADGAEGWPEGAPYDLIIATCSVREVPVAWLGQLAPDGRIVTPWSTSWCTYGSAALARQPDGTAAGRLVAGGSYMPLRQPGSRPADGADLARDVLRAGQVPEVSQTRVSPWSVAGGDFEAQLVMGLRVPGVWHVWDAEPDVEGVHVRLWLGDESGESWAAVDADGQQLDTFGVAQWGPRRLWDEVEAAWRWWEARGRPEVGRFGLTVTAAGQEVWLDHVDQVVRTTAVASSQ